jgi:hypothetical protein
LVWNEDDLKGVPAVVGMDADGDGVSRFGVLDVI